MVLADLNRAQDAQRATLKLSSIVPKDWHKFPPRTASMVKPYAPVYTYDGGIYGDDVYLAKTTVVVDERGIGDYEPRNQDDKAKFPGPPNSIVPSESISGGQARTVIADYSLAVDVTAPRGWIGPRDPYSKPKPAAPTISSLAPNTAVAGSPGPLTVIVTGTGFTQWTKLIVGGAEAQEIQYASPTKMVLSMHPEVSVPGVITVYAWDHSEASAPSNFTYT
jgi:IPT/TIG domain